MTELDFHTATARKYRDSAESDYYADERWTGKRRKTDLLERATVRSVLERIGANGVFLDLPAGTGRFAPVLAGFSAELVECDVSNFMLGRAREFCVENGVETPLSFVAADALKLPFRELSFDLVFSNRLYHHFNDAEVRTAFLSELARVTKKWALVSFYNSAALLSVRRKISCALKGRKPTRFAVNASVIADEAARAGFKLEAVYPIRKFISPQHYALLKKA